MKLGLIGCGRMGGALVEGAVNAGIVKPEDLWLSSRTLESAQNLAKITGGHTAESNAEVIDHVDLALLGCKPYQVVDVLENLSPSLPGSTAIVSLAAGISLQTMQSACPADTRIIRAMPNTPCMIGIGATGIAPGDHATSRDINLTVKLMESVGIAVVTTEKQLDAVTGVSGSGPAYIYTMIKAMADQGTLEGLDPEDALKLATQTALGAAEMIARTGKQPQDLIDQVTSPGGTTLAGLAILTEQNFEQIVSNCVHTATERSREIARGE